LMASKAKLFAATFMGLRHPHSHPNNTPQSFPNLVTPYPGVGKDSRIAEADPGSSA
jgi:hypothetical protein